jgi:hypothetical protein
MAIKSISYELLDKNKLTTDILLRFQDNNVNQIQYSFIKDRLDNFNLLLDKEYSVIINAKYDVFKDIMYIELLLSISDLFKPKDLQLEQIINHHSYRFIKFYERNIEVFNNKK